MKIDINDAIISTGKSLSTLRRLTKNPKSKPYIENKDGKILIDVNYLYSVYPPKNDNSNSKNDTIQNELMNSHSMSSHVLELQNKIIELEKELIAKKTALEFQNKINIQQNDRIEDLKNTIRLLDFKKNEDINIQKKKKWWQF